MEHTGKNMHLPPILEGQKAVVTGGSSGIGAACVRALAGAGADVVINYRKGREEAEKLAAEIEQLGRRALPVQGDVGDENDANSLIDTAVRELGTVDILVNNAGMQDDAPFEDMTLAQWERVLRVNLTGQFLCARAAVREFKRRGVVPEVSAAAGKIINMSSVHDAIPWAGHVNYAASKGGVQMFTKSIAQELAGDHIRVLAVAPGAIRTRINTEAWETQEAYDELMKLVPADRIGEPHDIGNVLVWLASDYSDYITGTTTYVDGGMMLYPGFTSGG